MRGNKFTESLDPNEKNITFTIIAVLALWYDIFFAQTTYMGRLFSIEEPPIGINSPIYALLFGWIPPESILTDIAAFLSIIGIAGLLIRFNGHFAYIKVRTILPAIVFCAIGTALFRHTITPGILIALLLTETLFATFFYVETFNPIYAFNAGLLTATMALLSPTLMLLGIPYLAFLRNTSTLNLRSLMATAFGFAVPLLYAGLYYAIIGEMETITRFFTASFHPFSVTYDFSEMEVTYLSFLCATSVLAIGNFVIDKTHDNIKSRKQNTHINNLLLWIFTLMALGVPDSQNLLYALTLAWGLALGRYFSVNSSRFAYILFFVFIGLSLVTYIIA